jgi:glycosyltransferase involved in cell wall biosynthesis
MHTVAGLPLMESTGLKRLVLLLTERATYFCAQKVYPNSEGLRAYMKQSLGVSDRKMKIIGKGSSNGINSAFFARTPDLEIERQRLREQHGIGPADIVFSFVGRIVRDKGIGELIRAFRTIENNARDQRVFLLLVGPFEQELDPLDAEDYAYLHNNKNVILAGFQQDVRPWLVASDVFVFPSYREGFPNVVMQASCLEVPCIVSDINGCNEIVQQGESGLIVPVKDADALCRAMERMADDPALRKRFATAARNHVVSSFDQRYVWTELQNEYKTLLKLMKPGSVQ